MKNPRRALARGAKIAGTGNAVMPTDAPFFPDALLIKRAFVSRRDATRRRPAYDLFSLSLSLSFSLFFSFSFCFRGERTNGEQRRDDGTSFRPR